MISQITLNKKLLSINSFRNFSVSWKRQAQALKKGIVVGVYENSELTTVASRVDSESKGKVKDMLKDSTMKLGHTSVAHNLVTGYDAVALVGVGNKTVSGINLSESLDEQRENIRIATARAVNHLLDEGLTHIEVDPIGNAEAAAEGSILSLWRFDYLKSDDNKRPEPEVTCSDSNESSAWERGRIKADAQNLARVLTQCPSNLMTPTHFAQCTIDKLCPCGVQVEARDRKWIEAQNMESLLAMASGSMEPPIVLEIAYCGANPDDKPVMMIGKGVTFDGQGVCLDRKCNAEFSADVAGAAVVVGTIKALCELKVPINVNAIIPLCENMPGGNAAAPGAVFTALNGRTIRMDDTAHDGRIFMVDALCYAEKYKPCLVMNVATLDEVMRLALGDGATATYTMSDSIWKNLHDAGALTGDRLWRLPLWNHYRLAIESDRGADLTTVGKGLGRGGDPCTAAAFLKTFAPPCEFVHLDITGTGRLGSGVGYPYLRNNLMTGRPVRTLVEFLCKQASQKN
ncbi:cytosol aminopeptidase [Nilaparvata lugens]|uniref:cytosol aminopeptidase n=1 Tax=Nilaparvata lugens TaxID=108931 RepID=UPI00193E5838|nr:cytosol aminopeptidase [Nilaparvata lugens]